MTNREGIENAKFIARDVFAVLCPGIPNLPIREPKNQGKTYYTFLAGDMVIRIARSEAVRQGMESEIAVMRGLAAIKEKGADVPNVIFSDISRGVMVIERMSGIELTPKLLKSLPEKEQTEIATRIGKFIAVMNDGPAPARTIMRTDKWYSRKDDLDMLHQAFLSSADPETYTRLRTIRGYVARHDSLADHFARSHNDLWPGNILYDPSLKALSVIDFDRVRANFVHLEFSRLARFYGMDFTKQAAAGYKAASGRGVRMDMVKLSQDLRAVYEQMKKGEPVRLTPAA